MLLPTSFGPSCCIRRRNRELLCDIHPYVSTSICPSIPIAFEKKAQHQPFSTLQRVDGRHNFYKCKSLWQLKSEFIWWQHHLWSNIYCVVILLKPKKEGSYLSFTIFPFKSSSLAPSSVSSLSWKEECNKVHSS